MIIAYTVGFVISDISQMSLATCSLLCKSRSHSCLEVTEVSPVRKGAIHSHKHYYYGYVRKRPTTSITFAMTFSKMFSVVIKRLHDNNLYVHRGILLRKLNDNQYNIITRFCLRRLIYTNDCSFLRSLGIIP